ncbi:tetratricopeptide repeat protein [Alteromonas sp. CYL-A6]|uniref:tetratricopeptide repeat protein n=1 Tax=Alteromonas nitratireducens TaxID=3390813 RepID=UPI0034B16E2E
MRGLLFALLAMLLVTGDTTSAISALRKNALAASNPAALLYRASLLGDQVAQDMLVDYATMQKNRYWLQRMVALDHPEAAWALYELRGPEASEGELMELAAKGGVPQAQLAYAMSVDGAELRERWLKKSANQGYEPAQAALADWYLLQEQPEKARPWLALTADNDNQAAYKYGRLLWETGNREEGKAYLIRSAQSGNDTARALLDILGRYQPQPPAEVTAYSWPARDCKQRIQFFAASLPTIQRADTFYRAFKSDDRLATLPICVAPPVWLPRDTLNCDKDWRGSGRLGCDIRPVAPAVDARDATHIVVVAEQGKANVHNGVMYLDISDAYSVFVHELAHFSGFADEYPMTASAARRFCQPASMPINQSPNIVFHGALTYAPARTLSRWQTLSPGHGIWPAKTCESVDAPAYKPSGEITFMEHHDSGVIPPLYLKLWQAQINDRTQQRPVSMNLFQAFHGAGQTPQAGYWLSRYHRETGQAGQAAGAN